MGWKPMLRLTSVLGLVPELSASHQFLRLLVLEFEGITLNST